MVSFQNSLRGYNRIAKISFVRMLKRFDSLKIMPYIYLKLSSSCEIKPWLYFEKEMIGPGFQCFCNLKNSWIADVLDLRGKYFICLRMSELFAICSLFFMLDTRTGIRNLSIDLISFYVLVQLSGNICNTNDLNHLSHQSLIFTMS